MGVFGRAITCKGCGVKGVIEAVDTASYPANKVFKFLGKDPKGYMHFKCPSCGAEPGYGPTTFINPVVKIIGFLIILAIAWFIYNLFG